MALHRRSPAARRFARRPSGRSSTPWPTSCVLQQHDHRHHGSAGEHARVGDCRNCGFKGSRKSTPFAAQVAAEKAGNAAKDYGVKNLEVRVKGPGPGRESAVRALNASGSESPRSKTSLRFLTTAVVRRRSGGSKRKKTWRDTEAQLASLRVAKALTCSEERAQAAREQVQARSPPGGAGQRRTRCRITACNCARSRSCAACTACSSGSSATTTRRPRRSKARRARTCCGCSRRASTTWCTAWASRRRARKRASSWPSRHQGQRADREHPVVSAQGGRQDCRS